MGGSCCPPALQPGCQTRYFQSVTVDPPILVCGSVCTSLLVVLCTPWSDLGLVLCLVLRSCWIYLCLHVNSGVKDFFFLFSSTQNPVELLRTAGFGASPSHMTGMSWQKDLSSWEPLLCPCLSEQREGGHYRMSHRLDELFWQGLTLVYSDVSRHSWMKCNGLKFCDDLCLN